MIFLDVVYNHFGPDGNYIASYAPEFFRDDVKTPWGPAIDFRRPQVRQYFTENALYWLMMVCAARYCCRCSGSRCAKRSRRTS